MSSTLFTIFNHAVTPWHFVGAAGFGIFSLRWFIQIFASRKAGKSIFPDIFWYTSIVGSVLMMLYFWEDKHDPVGVLSNGLPFVLASYNVALLRFFKKPGAGSAPTASPESSYTE